MNNTVDNTVTIEFGLPNGASGQAAVYHSARLRKSITKWAEERCVAVEYSTEHRKYRHWLTVKFNKESDLTLFALSWNMETVLCRGVE
jgi:cob(I)alamin adenosyltransferase